MHCTCYFKGSGEVGSQFGEKCPAFPKGVTLAELMVTLAIIAILAAMAIPGLSGFFSKKAFYCQADELCAVFDRGREKAVENGHTWRIVFMPGDRSWYCYGDENSNNRMDSDEERLGPYRLETGIFFGCSVSTGPNDTAVPSDGISLADNRVSFSPLGSCNAGTIFIRHGSQNLALRVFPASGTIRTYEYSSGWRELR
jgi:prepilin-type N-terminal cleavage/methylation domain-containing protein